MKKEIPYHKIVRLAIITSVLFGLFGATPVFEFGRKDFNHIGRASLVVIVITLFLWLINTGLLWAGQKMVLFNHNWFRYLISIIFSGIIIILLSEYFLPHYFPRIHEIDKASGEMQNLAPKLEPLPNAGFYRLPANRHHIFFPFLQILSLNVFIIVLLEMVLLKNAKEKIEHENNLLRLANLQARHSQLKQQLQPHFLFNSLNTLKALIKKRPLQAEDYLKKLSDLLRFSIRSSTETLISVEKEIELVNNYLLMQKIRFGNAIHFDISIPRNLQSAGSNKIPGYSLLLLAENAIKHNVITIENPLSIFITAQPGKNTLTVFNNFQPKSSIEISSGLGLANLTERYKILGNYDVIIKQTAASFTVTIKIIKDEQNTIGPVSDM